MIIGAANAICGEATATATASNKNAAFIFKKTLLVYLKLNFNCRSQIYRHIDFPSQLENLI